MAWDSIQWSRSWFDVLSRLFPYIVEDLSPEAVRQAASVIHHADAPILAAAITPRVDYLITWNTRHFHKASVRTFAPFPIVTPAEFLAAFRRALLEE